MRVRRSGEERHRKRDAHSRTINKTSVRLPERGAGPSHSLPPIEARCKMDAPSLSWSGAHSQPSELCGPGILADAQGYRAGGRCCQGRHQARPRWHCGPGTLLMHKGTELEAASVKGSIAEETMNGRAWGGSEESTTGVLRLNAKGELLVLPRTWLQTWFRRTRHLGTRSVLPAGGWD